MTEAPKKDDELSIYTERMMRFIQLLRLYEMVLATSDEDDRSEPHLTMRGTMMSVVYSLFYSLIEPDPKEIEFFRIWRTRLPEMSAEISALEARVAPMRNGLRLFRNRFGFHGSTSREHESPAFDVLFDHDGLDIYQAILETRNLLTKLIQVLGKEVPDAASGWKVGMPVRPP